LFGSAWNQACSMIREIGITMFADEGQRARLAISPVPSSHRHHISTARGAPTNHSTVAVVKKSYACSYPVDRSAVRERRRVPSMSPIRSIA
jgi:hypothetical protein